MHPEIEKWTDLRCHPARRSAPVRSIRASVTRLAGGTARVRFRLDGDVSQIRVPSPAAPRFATELWRHTCFEVFIAADNEHAYHELNLSPSREWTVYAFRGYRDGAAVSDEVMNPNIAVHSTANALELDALVQLGRLSQAHENIWLRIGLGAVIEADDGLSYWALSHANHRPDFHDRRGFSLLLEPPDRG